LRFFGTTFTQRRKNAKDFHYSSLRNLCGFSGFACISFLFGFRLRVGETQFFQVNGEKGLSRMVTVNKINRNAPCPCGSGRKYKKCCGLDGQSHMNGLTAGIRMKGGVLFDEKVEGYVPIVHTWDNVHCYGEPTEWRSPRVFPTEEGAMRYYETYIRPDLQRLMSKIESQQPGGISFHRRFD
jgi:hypothetical protein